MTLVLWSRVIWLFSRYVLYSDYLLNSVIIVSSLLNLIKHNSEVYLGNLALYECELSFY